MPKSRTPSSGKANRYGNEDYARRTLTTTIADPVSITGSSTRHDGMKSLGRPSPAAKATVGHTERQPTIVPQYSCPRNRVRAKKGTEG